MSGYVGRDLPRVDGPHKVTGSARYAGEIALPDLAYAEIVGAAIASGRVTSIDVSAALAAAGVAAVLTRDDMPRMNHVPQALSLFGGPAPGQTFFPMQDDVIHYAGQDPLLAGRPVGDIGARWGLVNPSQLSRHFRDVYNISPREYRAAHNRLPEAH